MSAEPGVDAVHQAFGSFWDNFDKKMGALAVHLSFPTPHNLIFLMEYGVREKKPEALAMAETTLVQMYRGEFLTTLRRILQIFWMKHGWCRILKKCFYDNALLVMAYVGSVWPDWT